MKERILQELGDTEKKHGVKIIFACESGSRAWGFASEDSDYDVRFIYVHPKDWYLSIEKKRDVIELPLHKVLDINGWDIRKSLRLLRKSNPPLLEWLSSPIVYRNVSSAMTPFIQLSKLSFLPESSCHHYLSMARNSMAMFNEKAETKIKNYLYALRSVLCCKWIIREMNQPPMLLRDLVLKFFPSGEFRHFTDQLIQLKRDGSEASQVKRSMFFEDCLKKELNELENNIPKNPNRMPVEKFDRVFKEILRKEL